MSHSLVEISPRYWAKLRDLYSEHRNEISGYGLLQTMIQWIEKDPMLNLKIYSLDGDWKTDGTFVVILNDLAYPHIFLNTLSNNLERLTAALNCLDPNSKLIFFSFSERVKPAVKEFIRYAGGDVEKFNPEPTPWYYIEREKALNFQTDIPNNYKISSLEEKHAEQINSIWPHRSTGSIEFVKLLIRLNDNIGLFDNAGNLIAWCLRLPVGSLGLLHVIDGYKRQGLGNLVVRCIAKLIGSKNEEVMAPVVETNVASRTMFEKLGFAAIDNAYWEYKEGKKKTVTYAN